MSSSTNLAAHHIVPLTAVRCFAMLASAAVVPALGKAVAAKRRVAQSPAFHRVRCAVRQVA